MWTYSTSVSSKSKIYNEERSGQNSVKTLGIKACEGYKRAASLLVANGHGFYSPSALHQFRTMVSKLLCLEWLQSKILLIRQSIGNCHFANSRVSFTEPTLFSNKRFQVPGTTAIGHHLQIISISMTLHKHAIPLKFLDRTNLKDYKSRHGEHSNHASVNALLGEVSDFICHGGHRCAAYFRILWYSLFCIV